MSFMLMKSQSQKMTHTDIYKENYLGFLDGIRGFLAFWVFFYHLSMACIAKSAPWGGGAIAVDIFMLLSGFLMAYHWNIRKNRFNSFKHQLLDFYIRRFFRIAPLYYVLLTLAFLGNKYFFEMGKLITQVVPPPWLDAATQESIATSHGLDIFNILAHYTFLFGFIPDYVSASILPDWSIGLEMQFYLVFPFVILLISRFGAFPVILSLSVASYITNKLLGLYLSPGILGNFPQPSLILFKINIFAAGISIAYTYYSKTSKRRIYWALLAALSLFSANSRVWIIACLIVFMLLFNNDKKEWIDKIMSCRLAKFLGDTSYSVYLVHMMIYMPILYKLFQYEWYLNLSDNYRLAIAFVFSAIPVYVVSYFLYRFIELKGIRIGRFIMQNSARRFGNQSPTFHKNHVK